MAPVRCVFRLVAVIFTYDGDAVSCFKYAFKGPHVISQVPDSNPHYAALNSAISQVLRKPFEVEDELMELEMNLLWVTFFMPILPLGVIITMVARRIERYTDVTKMLFVRRRPVPVSDRNMRKEMTSYSSCVAIGCV